MSLSFLSVAAIAGSTVPQPPQGRPVPTPPQLHSKVLPKINYQEKRRPIQASVSLSKEKEFTIDSK